MLDPSVLQAVIPGADLVEQHAPGGYRASLSFGVGRLRGRYATRLNLENVDPCRSRDMAGDSSGRCGEGWATAHVLLDGPAAGPTRIIWHYDGGVSGLVAYAGRPVLQMAGHLFVERFFRALAQRFS